MPGSNRGSKDPGSPSLAESIAKAVEEKKQLDEIDSTLSERIGAVEEALAPLRGVRIVVGIGGGDYLAFDKFRGQWRLLIEVSPSAEGEEWTCTPLKDCDRNTRARVLSFYLAALVANAADQITSLRESRAQALSATEDILGVLGKKPKGTP